jgi:hypothetical protein
MKKGLTITLLTVALAMIGFQAMAMAPVIESIPSPIVGSADVTATNVFVYPDAINLTAYVSDDSSPSASIIWSYEETGTKYLLNGVAPINNTDAAGIEVTPGAKRIDNQDLDPIAGGDPNPKTITIRNSSLSPIGGSTTFPSTTGIVPAETGTITLFASDGSTFGQRDLVIYTDNGGLDRLSGVGENPPVPIDILKPWDTSSAATTWLSSTVAGTITYSRTTNSICLEAPVSGDNWGIWVGPANQLPLVKNAVYDIKMSMTSTNATPGHTPFWDVSLDNNNNDGTGPNLYGADQFFLDNETGANAAIATAKDFHIVWTPLAMSTNQFKGEGTFTGTETLFSTDHATDAGGRFIFRVMDLYLNGTSGILANQQYGTVCIVGFTINRYNMTLMTKQGATLYDNHGFNTTSGSAGCVTPVALVANALTLDYSGGMINVTPTVAGQTAAYTTIYPGDTVNVFSGLPADVANQADNYPVAYDPNSIYRIQVSLAAPDASSQTNPADVFWIMADSPTQEVIMQSFVTSHIGACAMPKTGTPQIYTAFYHTNFGSNTAINPGWKRFRPIFTVCNLASLSGPGNHTGSTQISKMAVDKVIW